MKRIATLVLFLSGVLGLHAQNPGLVISEVLANPNGTDSPFEWIELIATQNIDFSVTPYSVVACNNGTGTTNGWISGGTLSYAFQINSGTVTAGQVVYVGGSTMAPTGTKIRVINTGTTAGDGFGNAQTGGVIGNGGANADGIAVFNLPVASLTNSTVPTDAIFYGTAIGTALVNAGVDGYQLPVNDRYVGGKLQSSSFFAGDPGSDVSIKASGFFNTASNSWFGQRTWSTQTAVNDNTSAITLGTVDPPGTGVISSATQAVSEAAGTFNVNVTFSSANNTPAKFVIDRVMYTDAEFGTDFTWSNDTLVIPANSNGTFPFAITLIDDALAERTERIVVKLRAVSNALTTAANYQIVFVKDNDYQAPVGNNELILNNLTSFSNGTEGANSAEIVAHDPTTDRLYIANSVGAKIDIVNFSNPASPTLMNSVSVTPYGNINSLTVHNGIVVVAMENSNPQLNGSVVFFDANGTFISQVTVGAMPDMITFNNDFTKVIVACEGEPKTDYSIDPEGTIGIIDLTPGIPALTNANVALVNFQAYNGQEAALRSQGIRIFGPGSSTAQDFEPEYITISSDNTKAYISLQENNAMAVIDLQTGSILNLYPLGTVDYSSGNGLDPSDQSTGIYIGSAPVKGLFMPDALAHLSIGGTDYIFSANEGDAREYTAYSEVTRLSGANLDASFTDQNILKNNNFLGRLNITKASGDTDNDGDIDVIHTFSTRSFAIWNGETGALVFDSKDLLEQITATHPACAGFFNASNVSGAAVSKNRSDDKGPEVEGVATAVINGNNYLFASMERVGGVMIFNVDNPAAPVFVGYYNNRTLAANGPDRGAEGIIIIKKEDSPTNKDIVILANEISSTLSVFEINTCVDLAGAIFTAPTDSVCSGNTVQLTATGASNSTYQWFKDHAAINGQIGTSLTVNQSGNYQLYVTNSALACADTTVSTTISVLPLPVVVAGPDENVCLGTSVTLNGSGAQNYNWNNGATNGVAFVPSTTTTYTVTGTDAYGCSNTAQTTVTVKPLPTPFVPSNFALCQGALATLTATGGVSATWNNGVSNGVAFTPSATTTYTATVTGANGCTNTAQTTVTINPNPIANAPANFAICQGESTSLTATGGTSVSWNNGISNGVSFTPSTTTTYTATVTDVNGCTAQDQTIVTVNPLPVAGTTPDFEICVGQSATLNATGGVLVSWDNNVSNGVTFTPSATATYTATVTNSFGCEDEAQTTVTVHALPTVDAGNTITVCQGETVVLSASGATTYNWSNNAANGSSIMPSTSAVLTVIGTDSNGCSDDDQLVITVNALPQVLAGSDLEVCAGTSVTLNASGADSLVWTNGVQNGVAFIPQTSGTYQVTAVGVNGCENSDELNVTVHANPVVDLGEDSTTCSYYGPILLDAGNGYINYDWNTNAHTQTISATFSGTYVVTVTDNNGCNGTDAVQLIFDPCLGIEEQETLVVAIYPNPTNACITVEVSEANFVYELMDFNGALLKTGVVQSNQSEIDLSEYAQGVYMVNILQNGQRHTERIVKH